jgi:hypothetical protein
MQLVTIPKTGVSRFTASDLRLSFKAQGLKGNALKAAVREQLLTAQPMADAFFAKSRQDGDIVTKISVSKTGVKTVVLTPQKEAKAQADRLRAAKMEALLKEHGIEIPV